MTDLRGGGRAGSRLPPRPAPARLAPAVRGVPPAGIPPFGRPHRGPQTVAKLRQCGGGCGVPPEPGRGQRGTRSATQPAPAASAGAFSQHFTPQSSDTTDTVSLPDPQTCLLCSETVKDSPSVPFFNSLYLLVLRKLKISKCLYQLISRSVCSSYQSCLKTTLSVIACNLTELELFRQMPLADTLLAALQISP